MTTATTKKPVTAQFTPTPVEEIDEDKLVSVLFGYGRVAPTSRSYLDDYLVEGGVVRNVPYSLAKHWQNGTRPDGKKSNGRVKIQILPQDATESDFMLAVGLSPEEIHALALRFKGTNVEAIIAQLGVEGARDLFNTLSKHFNGR